MSPRLSTVALPLEEIGMRAVELALNPDVDADDVHERVRRPSRSAGQHAPTLTSMFEPSTPRIFDSVRWVTLGSGSLRKAHSQTSVYIRLAPTRT